MILLQGGLDDLVLQDGSEFSLQALRVSKGGINLHRYEDEYPGSVEEAVEALQALEIEPTKAKVQKAERVVAKIEKVISKPVVNAKIDSIQPLRRIKSQLKSRLRAIEAVRKRERQQEEATIVLLLAS